MDRDTVIRLAREAGFFVGAYEGVDEVFEQACEYWDEHPDIGYQVQTHNIERFAELVLANAAKEAQVSDAFAKALGQVDAHLASVSARVKTVEDAVLEEREKVARWMMERGYATGHGDTIEDLLTELEWQLKEKPK